MYDRNNEENLVSIGMSVFNSAGTLEMAVRSVVNQTYQNWELVIIDDGSTDKSPEIIRSFNDARIKYHSDGVNKGLATRLNELVQLSVGKYFARMDTDDVCYPERLQKQVEYLNSHDKVDLLSTRVLVFDDEFECMGTYPFHENHEEICSRPLSGFYMPHPTWMGRKEWFLKHLYNEESFMSEDQELLLRTCESSTFHCLDQILLGYRIPGLTVKKEFKTRLSRVMDYSRIYRRKKKYFLILKLVVLQSIKFIYSAISISTPFAFRLLKNRALPVAEDECERWYKVIDELGSVGDSK